MEKITIELTGRETNMILAGLLYEAYQYGEQEEKYDLRITENELEGRGTELVTVWRDRARQSKKIAYALYEKIKNDALKKGIIQ